MSPPLDIAIVGAGLGGLAAAAALRPHGHRIKVPLADAITSPAELSTDIRDVDVE